jgi:hypothetical protein
MIPYKIALCSKPARFVNKFVHVEMNLFVRSQEDLIEDGCAPCRKLQKTAASGKHVSLRHELPSLRLT